MQLVLIKNRIVAHGEGFLSMGGVVINAETGVKYDNATIAECENCPSDIDEVGYEYHAGEFVPCAPYGKGTGNIPVLCDRDCKTIKDSGLPLSSFGLVEQKSYKGDGTYGVSEGNNQSITFSGVPVVVFIHSNDQSGILMQSGGISWDTQIAAAVGKEVASITCEVEGNAINFRSLTSAKNGLNTSGTVYNATAIIIRGD